MKIHVTHGVGVYTCDPESARFETNDHSNVAAFDAGSGIEPLDERVAHAFDRSLVDPDEQIAAEKESNAELDKSSPREDGSSWSDGCSSDWIRERHAKQMQTVAEFRSQTGRKWPPVYRVKITTEAEEVSEEETERFWLERGEKEKWWRR